MNFEWHYFEPREIGFGIKEKAVACKIQKDKSVLYWVIDAEYGLKEFVLK